MERTFPRPFSGTFQISKNEDFNGPYLENENEFLKNSFETVFRASKFCDKDQLVSAFQLTFKLEHDDLENIKTNCENAVVFKLKPNQKLFKKLFFGTPGKLAMLYGVARC